MNDHIAVISGWYIDDLKQRDIYPLYACLTQQEKLADKNISDKMKYLSKNFPNIFETKTGAKTKEVEDYFTFKSYDEKILASNYIHGKGIDRKNWKRYVKGILPSIPLFYLELAFYLSIPSSDEIEKFMSLHGYSIKSPMTYFHDIKCGKRYAMYSTAICAAGLMLA